MCGIAGLVAADLSGAERLEFVRGMVARLRHRGPSGEALWDGGTCALGIARLAIVAPREPARVLECETGDVVGVANGELYNHNALERELLAGGHRFTPGPDTVLLPHLYEERGRDFPEALDGMFAIALWDRTTRTLTLARDRAGEKPLFVASSGRRFAFASEPGALLSLPWVGRAPSPAALSRYLVHGGFAGEDSAYAAIRQLPPASVLEVQDGLERMRRYWRPWDALVRAAARPGSGPAATAGDSGVASTREALMYAVTTRVPAEVPFGVFLSGGIDSGLVAVLAARAWGRPFPTFSLRLEHRGYDESPLARRVARSIRAEHHEVVMTPREGERAFHDWAAGMDQPLGDPSVLPTWWLARDAAKHVPVVLTGEGGDELFAGYPTYLGHRHAALADRLPQPVADAVLAIARALRPRHHHVTIAHLIERFLGTRGMGAFDRHLAWFGAVRPGEAASLLAPELRSAISADAPARHARHLERVLTDMEVMGDVKTAGAGSAGGVPGRTPLVAYQLLDFETYLPGDLLTKVDRCTMAHGVESRAPFLQAALVEHALSLPESSRLRGATGKWVLRKVAEDLLPPDLVARRKQGFSPPFSAWARGPLRGLVVDALSPARVRAAGVLDADAVQLLLRGHLDGREDRGRALWTLLSLQCWAERWLSTSSSAQAPPGAATHPASGEIAAAQS